MNLLKQENITRQEADIIQLLIKDKQILFFALVQVEKMKTQAIELNIKKNKMN